MALVKCAECGRDISSDASACPQCGKRRQFQAKPREILRGLFGLLVAIAAAVAVYNYWHGTTISTSAPQIEPTPNSTNTAASSASPDIDDKPLSNAETAIAFSNFVGQIQAKLMTMGFETQTYIGKLKQDAAFSDLNALRKESEDLKTMLISESAAMSAIPQPLNITDDDVEIFTNVAEAAEALAGDDVEVALDMAVSANYGFNAEASADMAKLAPKMKAERKALEKAVMSGYRHLGVAGASVNPATLTLKNP